MRVALDACCAMYLQFSGTRARPGVRIARLGQPKTGLPEPASVQRGAGSWPVRSKWRRSRSRIRFSISSKASGSGLLKMRRP